ncbi:unnamed protein product [Tenebrio molitor]|jgi:hypothetical protein|nr:unnamed protein product [Tenebrio molitor]
MVPRAMYDDTIGKCLWNLLVYITFIILSPIVLFVAIFVPNISLSIVRRICYIQFESV